jgi:hypothetical protein
VAAQPFGTAFTRQYAQNTAVTGVCPANKFVLGLSDTESGGLS